MKKINVITLGCSKNTVDSEHLMAQLAAAGYTVTHDSDRTDAKVVVINTCGFIGDAKQESIDMILRAAAAKQTGKIERLFVVGSGYFWQMGPEEVGCDWYESVGPS